MSPEQTPSTKEKSFFTVNVIGALILGLIVGFLIGAYFGKHSYNEDDMTMIDQNSASTTNSVSNTIAIGQKGAVTVVSAPAVTPGKNEAQVFDSAAGNNVVLKSVSLDNTYWVAVRDASSSGKAQYVLGARRLAPGTSSNVIISLSRNTVAGGQYELALYKSNGAAFSYDASNFVSTLGTFSVK